MATKNKAKTGKAAAATVEVPKAAAKTTAFDPLDALNDVLTGRIFDVPKAPNLNTEIAEETDNADEDDAGQQPAAAQPIINVNLAGLFKRSKRTAAPAAADEKAGTAAGDEE